MLKPVRGRADVPMDRIPSSMYHLDGVGGVSVGSRTRNVRGCAPPSRFAIVGLNHRITFSLPPRLSCAQCGSCCYQTSAILPELSEIRELTAVGCTLYTF